MKTFRYFINRWNKLEKQEIVGGGKGKKSRDDVPYKTPWLESYEKKNPRPGYPEEIRCKFCGKPSGLFSPCWRVFLTDYLCPHCGEVVVKATQTYC